MHKAVPGNRNFSEWPAPPALVWVGFRRAQVRQGDLGQVSRSHGGPAA